MKDRPRTERDEQVRAKYINARPANDTTAADRSMVLLSLNQVLEAVDNAVRNAVGDSVPRLLNREQLAERLSCSASTVDMLRREKGMPHIKLGDSPRFVYEDVVAWLSATKESA